MRVRAKKKFWDGANLRHPGEVFDLDISAAKVKQASALEPAEGSVIDEPERAFSDEQLARVLDALDHADESLWTDLGLVRMGVVEERLGTKKVGRKDIDRVRPNLSRSSAKNNILN